LDLLSLKELRSTSFVRIGWNAQDDSEVPASSEVSWRLVVQAAVGPAPENREEITLMRTEIITRMLSIPT
jgi:hypothetical protein